MRRTACGAIFAAILVVAACGSSPQSAGTEATTTTEFIAPAAGDTSAAVLLVDDACVGGSEVSALGYWVAAENEPPSWRFRGEVEGTLTVERFGEQALPDLAVFEADGFSLQMTTNGEDICEPWP